MTETTQPDPQVVAWMWDFMRRCPRADRAMVNVGAQEACGERTGRGRLTADALAACYEAARMPLTVADIPAGQGPASLYIAPDSDGDPAVWFKAADGVSDLVIYLGEWGGGDAALREHLAATLPTVTEETP